MKAAELKTAEDKRIKVCEICDETYRDNTRPNNKRTCSPECADIARRQRQRDKYAADTAHIPKKPTQYEIYQASHPEYPFWDLRVMQNLSQKYESLQPTDKVERIIGKRELAEFNGGKHKKPEVISYEGNEKGAHGISVRFADHSDKKPGEVVTTKMTAEEMGRYFEKTYRTKR